MKSANDRCVVLYDGRCSLCIKSAEIYRKSNKDSDLDWIDLNSSEGREISEKYSLDSESITLIENGKIKRESDAVVRLGEKSDGFTKIISLFSFLPKSFLDRIYRFISRNRHIFSGKVKGDSNGG